MTERGQQDVDSRELLRAYLEAVTLIESFEHQLEQRAHVTLVQARILRRLRSGPKVQTELGHDLGLSASSVTRLVDRMVAQGVVTRKRDATDARRVFVRLTPKGRSLFASVRVLQGSSVERAAQDMPPGRRKVLHDALKDFVDRVRTYDDV